LEDWKEERKRVSPNTTEHSKVTLFGEKQECPSDGMSKTNLIIGCKFSFFLKSDLWVLFC